MSTRTPILTLVAIIVLATGAAAQTAIAWTDTAERWRGQNGETISLVCPPRGGQIFNIWGTDIYTDDSSICGAALHAGVITEAGGAVTIEILAGQDAYRGTERNGVVTNPYPGWFGSFRFVVTGGKPGAAAQPAALPAVGETPAFVACQAAADYRVNGIGADPNQLDAEVAIGLCEAAVQELPDDFRVIAFLARALASAGRYDEALAAARTAADAGDATGQAVLGTLYLYGQGVPQDVAEALRLFRLAAEQGNPGGQNNLGTLHADGNGVPQDWTEAVRWFRLAAEQGMGVAMYNLGTRYLFGEGVPQDDTEAARWFGLGAEQGNAAAQANLALLHIRGQGVPQDYAEAARLFRLAAEQGYAPAQNSLGVMYQYGEGVPRDYAEAARWLGMAVEQGNTLAMLNLGAQYEMGAGVPVDLAEAERLYRLAVAGGDAGAQEHVDRVVALRATPAK